MLIPIVILFALCIEPPVPVELLPGLRVADGIVEFEGEIAVDAHHPDTPDVYLEMFITAPDSREHESLVVAKIQPSNLHAALLAAGFESGAPLVREESGVFVRAHGDSLRVLVALPAGEEEAPEFIPITDWAVHIDEQHAITKSDQWDGFVFAGSKFTNRGYAADADGTLVSLTSFGNEVVAPAWTLSHLAEVDEPVWIANRDLLPDKGESVVIRLVAEPKTESHEPERVNIDGDP
ncbi:MAG: YdjY domain-containing protein [Phycisphaerales bacterium JB052]